MYRGGLDRFKKAQSLEPFSVSSNSGTKARAPPPVPKLQPQGVQTKPQVQIQDHVSSGPAVSEVQPSNQHVTQVGGGQSTWQPPDWAIEPRPGVYYLEVLKDGQALDRIDLDRRRHIFGRQQPTCDFVLDHQSVSRQHAAVVPHRNGSIYVIDLGSVHGTFVANERLTKDIPMELEVGQSLKFAASTRTYILRKNTAALFPTPTIPADINLPSPPDPSDEEAVLQYNTILNRYGLSKSDVLSRSNKGSGQAPTGSKKSNGSERATKKRRKSRVAFKDQVGGELVQIVGISDGADVETEPGPIGVKEGSLVGKYESLVHTTVVPKGKDPILPKEDGFFSFSPKGVTDKLQEVLNKVKAPVKNAAIYDDLYGDSFSGMLGSSWAYSGGSKGRQTVSSKDDNGEPPNMTAKKPGVGSTCDDEEDDLFGD